MAPLRAVLGLGLSAVAHGSHRCSEAPCLYNPCLDKNQSYWKMPWCDPTQPLDARARDMVSRMSLKEKIGALGYEEEPIASLGLRVYKWWSEATHGVGDMIIDKETPYVTSFAFPITTAMSFNRSLWRETGARIGREARAVMNVGHAFSTFWAPVVNLAREPRWGRNIETPGEDPFVSGEYATAFVQGFQESPDDTTHLQASACCKHYVANEMDQSWEAGAHWDRMHFDANVTMQDLVDSYMAPFQTCVERGRVSGLMCSYNAVNGVPSCANDWLLKDVARGAWGFDGYVTADCDADSDVYFSHHYTKTPEEAVQKILRAGTDSDCGQFVSKYVQGALDKGLVTEKDLDERLVQLFRVRLRLSHFDPLGPLDKIGLDEVCTDAAKALAREGVAQSAALVKNSNKTLPLKAESLASVAVIGPNANLSKSITGYYGPSNPCGGDFWTMVDAVKQYVPNVRFAQGLASPVSNDTSLFDDARKAAAGADHAVLVLGTDLHQAKEGHDASSVALPQGQLALAKAVMEAAKGPITVAMLTATPLDISALLEDPRVGAVLHLGQPNVQVIGAGDVLFGKRVPSGRLVQTVYPASYAGQVSIFDFNMRPGPSAWPRPDCPKEEWGHCKLGTNPGRTHRFYVDKPVLPFGFGLSYTSFQYKIVSSPSSISLAPLQPLLEGAKMGFVKSEEVAAAGPAAHYIVEVSNTGDVDADDVVLGFLVPPGAGKDGVPLQTLFGFERVHVPAGESRRVTLYPAWPDFSSVDKTGSRRALPGVYTVRFGLRWQGAEGVGFAESILEAFPVEVVV